MTLHPRALPYGMVTSSDEEAQAALDEQVTDADDVEEHGRKIRARQVAARNAGDLNALAHWSRLRWRWLVATGRAEVRS